MLEINKIINGINFQQAADIIFDHGRKEEAVEKIKNLKENAIVWCKTDYLLELFAHIVHCPHKIILITQDSDYSITENIFQNRPQNVMKWCAINPTYQHKDLIPIPLGVENHYGPTKGANIDINLLSSMIENKEKNKIIDSIFCAFSVVSNSPPTRSKSFKALSEKNIASFHSRLSFDNYCKEMNKYLFVASPQGNGLDCHRTWEALYMGCVPLVDKHFMYDGYNLPIVQIEDWEKINLEMLHPYIEAYKNQTLFNNTEELYMDFWIKKIRSLNL